MLVSIRVSETDSAPHLVYIALQRQPRSFCIPNVLVIHLSHEMSLLTRRLIPAAALFLIASTNAQTCYYPDGKTISKDVPCDSSASGSSCCGSDSFCLAGGLCYSGGLVTRGSCTDKNWGSPACAGYCKNGTKRQQWIWLMLDLMLHSGFIYFGCNHTMHE